MNSKLGIRIAVSAACLLCPAWAAPPYTPTFSIAPSAISANAGDVGDSFDVVLTNDATSTENISIAAFAFEISVINPDITLTGADFNTGAIPYIFPLSDSFVALNPPFTLNIDSGQTLDASDLTNDGAGITIAPGQSVALGDILFDVASGAAPGLFPVSFTGVPSGGVVVDSNNLSDPNGIAVNVETFSGGTISIGGTSVPEPNAA